MQSEAVDDYLKAIFELCRDQGRAKTSDLAGKLGVTAGAVTDMVKRLARSRPDLLRHKLHYGATLTPDGEKVALGIIRRHRLLETFLHRHLNLSWQEVHQEAEVLEHYLSDRVTDALEQFLDSPDYDPHGDAIPDRNGALPPETRVTLAELEPGQAFCLERVEPAEESLLAHLDALGFAIGSQGMVTAKTPLDGLVTVGLESHVATLGPGVTDKLFVRILEP